MSYNVHNFRTGETIEAGPVNEMDQQIQTNESNIADKANSNNPVFTGSISMDRYGNAGSGSVSVGSGNEASGNQSFAEGRGTAATGTVSHAEGEGTKATHKAQRVFGMYNKADPSAAAGTAKGTYIEIVGNGTDTQESKRSNARTLDWDGNERLKGDLYVGCNANSSGGKKVLTGDNPVFTGSISMGRKEGTTVGVGSLAVGINAEASGRTGFAFGNYVTASGYESFATGSNTTASGSSAHAEGSGTTTSSGQVKTTASGSASHAEGSGTTASGNASHSEGSLTVASGTNAHASGYMTTASGQQSSAHGYGTISKKRCQFVFGKYNVQDNDISSDYGQYVEIVGNGTLNYGVENRSNARTLDWNGNESLAGSITLGKGTTDEVTLTAAQLKQLLALLT